MVIYGKIKKFVGTRINVGKTLRESFNFVSDFINPDSAGNTERRRIRHAVNSLVFYLLSNDGRISLERRDICRKLWEECFDHTYAELSVQELFSLTPAEPDEAISVLDTLPMAHKQQILEFLLALAVEIGDADEDIEFVISICERIGSDSALLRELRLKLQDENRKRKMLVSSGWGVVVAVGVILLFIITATMLESVIFGLIIGCLLLPLEKYIEKQIRNRSGMFYWMCAVGSGVLAPLRKLSAMLTRTAAEHQEDVSDKKESMIIRKAVAMTMVVSLLMLFALGVCITKISGHYMHNLRAALRESSPISEENSQYVKRINSQLDAWRLRFEKLPPVKSAIDFAGQVVNDPGARQKLGGELLKRSGGMFELTVDFFGAITAFFGNLLLTIFFALLFLFKLAEFCQNDGSDKSKSEYMVRTIFNGIWLPDADETIVAEARRIIEGVFFRLRVWLKGYLTLVIVDSTVYTTIFFFMDLPFFWLLGIIAGCGILLPYLGPVISCAITLLVALAVGGASGTLFFGIIAAYLIYNGIIEQFILYPAVIGEALGLSTLETIIVVLLGAIFAGIPGMIFALPAASVAKYIVPQLYRNVLRPAVSKRSGEAI